MLVWRDAAQEKPELNKPVAIIGPSGYIDPHSTFIVAGFYDSTRVVAPWRDCRGKALADYGFIPQRWCYLEEMNLPDVRT